MKKREWSLRDLWDTLIKISIHIEGVSEGKEREKWTEIILEEIMVKNVPNLMKYITVNIQKTQQIPSKMNSKRTMPRHITIKLPKEKDREP